MAKNLGARVVAVCINKNHELVKSLGADEVIDYRNTDLKTIEKVDVIFDTVGNLKFEDHEHLLNSGGIFLQAVATFGELFAKKNRADNKKFLTGTAPEKQEDLAKIREMLLEGKLKPMVDQIFNFDGIQKAHQYVETGHKKGGVVVKIED
jgi:NADPH:quinone reductase-like Zn-dependent oxidoreductase